MSIEIPLEQALTVEQAIAAANAAKISAQQALANIPAAIDAAVGPASAPYISQSEAARDAAVVAKTAAETARDNALAAATAAAVSAATFASVAGEVGVTNSGFPVGDVRRYGVFPDAVDLVGLTFTPGSSVVASASNAFTAGMVGMRLALAINSSSRIVSVAGDGSTATMTNAAPSNWASGVSYIVGTYVASGGFIYQCVTAHTSSGAIDAAKFQQIAAWPSAARVGTNWEADGASLMAAVYANAVNPLIHVIWPRGKYLTSLNFNGSASSGMRMHFAGCEFGLIHLLPDSGFPATGSALSDVTLTGDITIYDRFGAVGLRNSDLSRLNVRCKFDPTKNPTGTYGRGCHIYIQIKNNSFGEIVVDDCAVGTALNSDAAFSMDTSDCTGNVFRRIWVKTAAGHGFYALGPNNTFHDVRVDNWGYGAQDRDGQESLAAQNQELTGVWLRRCPGLKIGTLRVGLSGSAGASVAYVFRIEETTNSVLGGVFSTPRIESAFFTNLQSRGISIGDRNNLGSVGLSEVAFGMIHITPVSGATLASGYSMIHVNANAAPSSSGRNKLIAEKIEVYNPSASINDLLQVPAGTEVDIGSIDTNHYLGHAGGVFTFNGRGRIGRVQHLQAGGSGSPTTFTFNPDGNASVGQIDGVAPGSPSIMGLDLSSAGTGASNTANWEIGPVNLSGWRAAPAIMVNGAKNGLLKLGSISEATAVGWGLRFMNNTNVRVVGGLISGFAKGTTGSAGGNVRCSAANVQVTGNVTNTDLANGQALVDASSLNFTL